MWRKSQVLEAIADTDDEVQLYDARGKLHSGGLWRDDSLRDLFHMGDVCFETDMVKQITVEWDDTAVITLKPSE